MKSSLLSIDQKARKLAIAIHDHTLLSRYCYIQSCYYMTSVGSNYLQCSLFLLFSNCSLFRTSSLFTTSRRLSHKAKGVNSYNSIVVIKFLAEVGEINARVILSDVHV